MARKHGIRLKKKFGQHFLHDLSVLEPMFDNVELTKETSVFEIGGGEGFLTKAILRTPVKRLWVFEIDPEWAEHLKNSISDPRLTVFEQDFLSLDLELLQKHAPWTILANLPYQITFPLLHKFAQYRHLINEGVVMVQEEVAQKITKKRGKGFGYVSLFFQYYFDWKMLNKVHPNSFTPPPKVFSRLLYFKPKATVEPIVQELEFWQFIKDCFSHPRKMIKNNLILKNYPTSPFGQELLEKRPGELSIEEYKQLWKNLLKLRAH